MRLLWWLLAAFVLAGGVAPASAQTFVRAPFVRCIETPNADCPTPAANHGWVVLTNPQALADLPPGWHLVVDQTRFSSITVEVATDSQVYRIRRAQSELAGNWTLGDNLRFDIPVAGRDVRAAHPHL